MSEIQKQDLTSMNIAEEQLRKLKELFPEAFTEGLSVDWDKLRLTLGASIDVGKERYGMNWPGKADCFKTIQQSSIATLIPARDESVDFDKTKNLFIEGDNLEVLKLLQKSYLSKIKVMSFDPPYNTGSDFIYPDNFSESLDTYLKYTEQVDSEGRKYQTNLETDGRFHSKWMNMMYPRLFLAKNLLDHDGIIFIHINDKEVHNLKIIMNEIFGEENFVSQFIWASEGNTDNQFAIKIKHEYILAYIKNSEELNDAIGKVVDPNTKEDSNLWKGFAENNINKNNPANPPSIIELPVDFPADIKDLTYFKKNLDDEFFEITKKEKYISEKIKAKYSIEKQSGLPIKLDDLIIKDYKLTKKCRVYGGFGNINKLKAFIQNKLQPIVDDDGTPITFYINKNAAVRYHKVVEQPRNIVSVLQNLGTTEKTKTILKKMGIDFTYPKPVGLIKYLVSIGSQNNDFIALDIFSGSGTLAQSVIELNEETNGNRKFICVQLPEPVDPANEAYKAGFKTVAEISKERIRKIIKVTKDEISNKGTLFNSDSFQLDLGFKVFKLSKSNFKIWDNTLEKDPEALQTKLFEHIQHVSLEAEQEAILYELLLKSGFELTTLIEKLTLAGKTVFSIAEGQLLICLEKELTHDCIKAMAEMQPTRVICLDEGFKGENADALKTNAVQIMKSKGVVNFRTV